MRCPGDPHSLWRSKTNSLNVDFLKHYNLLKNAFCADEILTPLWPRCSAKYQCHLTFLSIKANLAQLAIAVIGLERNLPDLESHASEVLREALQFGQTQSTKCSLHLEQFCLFCFLKTHWTFVGWRGRVGRKSEGLLPSLSPPSHHDLHHYGATPLFDKVLGDDCMNKLSSIFTFWRDLPKFEEILKANFLPPHNDQYVKQPFGPRKSPCIRGNFLRARYWSFPFLPLSCASTLPMLSHA